MGFTFKSKKRGNMAVGNGDGMAHESAKRKRSGEDESAEADSMGRGVNGAWLVSSSVDARIRGDAQSKRKWTRLLLRELYDLGFPQAAECLEREASVCVRSNAMETLQGLVLAHQWDEALAFLQQQDQQEALASASSADDNANGVTTERLQMRSRAASKELSLLLLKRKFADLLLQKQLPEALETFQEQILPSYNMSQDEIQELAVLLLCRDQSQMETLVKLPLKDTELLGRIEALVSPDEVVPHGSLRRMVKWEDSTTKPVVSFAKVENVNLTCIALLLKHTHEVLDLAFSPDGNYLASVSRDSKIFIWELQFSELEDEKTGETTLAVAAKAVQVLQLDHGPASCIAWSPDGQRLLSGGGDECNIIQLWNPLTGRQGRSFQHPGESVACVSWLPDGKHFLSGSIEKSLVLWNAEGASVAYQWSGRRALDLAVHPKGDQVFVLCSETELRVYNLVDKSDRLLLRADHLIASMVMAPSGDFILLSFIEHEEIACFAVAADTIVSRQRGFKQERFVLRPCFAGSETELVVSGSEDGTIHVWLREDGKAIGSSSSHSSVVNVVASHPVHRGIIASASDDETVRLWHIGTT